jgi:hypothetical protein
LRLGLNRLMMFFSPCTRRSTQCAALIALATVAGIARVESNPQKTRAINTFESNSCVVPGTDPVTSRFTASPKWCAPWLQPFATLALWFLSADDYSERNLAAASSSTAESAPDAEPTLNIPSPFPAPPIEPTATSIDHGPELRVSTGSRSHFIPFAVGPPRSKPAPNLRANGTPMPTVDLARRFYDISVDHFFVPFFARLACRSFFRHPWVGLVFPPSFALRGAPNSLTAAIRFRRALRAHGARGGRLFPL